LLKIITKPPPRIQIRVISNPLSTIRYLKNW
jgi:hypothetical protein